MKELKKIDGEFADFRKNTIEQFTTPVSQEEFRILEKWNLKLIDCPATHSGKILQQAWSTELKIKCSKDTYHCTTCEHDVEMADNVKGIME